MSVLLRPAEPSRNAAQWSLLAGVALADVLSRYVPEPAVLALKWPNDVLMHGPKLAGILVESAADDAGCLAWLSIGVGVNLRRRRMWWAGTPPVSPSTSRRPRRRRWRPTCWRPSRTGARGGWPKGSRRCGPPFSPAPRRWARRSRCGLERTLGGTFEGLGEDGSLLVRTDGRVHAFAAGEVTIGNGA